MGSNLPVCSLCHEAEGRLRGQKLMAVLPVVLSNTIWFCFPSWSSWDLVTVDLGPIFQLYHLQPLCPWKSHLKTLIRCGFLVSHIEERSPRLIGSVPGFTYDDTNEFNNHHISHGVCTYYVILGSEWGLLPFEGGFIKRQEEAKAQ